MTKYARRSRRKVPPVRTDRPAREQIADRSSSLAPATGPAPAPAKSWAANLATSYDAQRQVISQLKYSALVGAVIAVLLVIAYILFR